MVWVVLEACPQPAAGCGEWCMCSNIGDVGAQEGAHTPPATGHGTGRRTSAGQRRQCGMGGGGNRHNSDCVLSLCRTIRWTASPPPAAWWCWQAPTAPTSWTRRCCDPGGGSRRVWWLDVVTRTCTCVTAPTTGQGAAAPRHVHSLFHARVHDARSRQGPVGPLLVCASPPALSPHATYWKGLHTSVCTAHAAS